MKTHGHAIILNRDFKLPEDGWYQVAPYGEIRAPMEIEGRDEPVEVVQVLNRAAAERIVARFREEAKQPNFPGLLIDYDHFSHDTEKSSAAAGWMVELEAREDGLWAKHRWSDEGETALKGGRYRLFSPVFGFAPRTYQRGERVEPAALLRGALTNDPRFKGMVPLSHRQGEPLASTHSTGDTMDYKAKLLALLGLPATATDAEIEAALGTAGETMNKGKSYDSVKNRADQLEAQQIERDLDDAGLQGEARESAKVVLTKNRAEGVKLLAALKKPESGYTRTHNRGSAKPPGAAATEDAATKAEEARAARIANRAAQIQRERKLPYSTAWAQAEAAEPAATK